MGRIHKKRRSMQIKQRLKRQQKLAKLRQAYKEVTLESRKKIILEKVFKLAPQLSKEEFLKPIESRKKEKKKDKK